MKTVDLNTNLIDSYFSVLKNLSSDNKLELISRLSKSMKSPKRIKTGSIKSLYGAFISDHSADEIIDEIKKARNFNRKRLDITIKII